MKTIMTCPSCGMWVHPQRIQKSWWPIRAYRRKMGGRYPNSRRGKITIEEVEVTPEFEDLVKSSLSDSANRLGYKLVPKDNDGTNRPGNRVLRGLGKGTAALAAGYVTQTARLAAVGPLTTRPVNPLEAMNPYIGRGNLANLGALVGGFALSVLGEYAEKGWAGDVAKAIAYGTLGGRGADVSSYMFDTPYSGTSGTTSVIRARLGLPGYLSDSNSRSKVAQVEPEKPPGGIGFF